MAIENLVDTTENCRYCLMCRHIAPVGTITYNESLTPRGIALTVASQRRGMIEWTEEAVNIVYSDPDGGNSRAHCVTDQPLPEALAAVRAQIAEQGLAPPTVYNTHKKLQEWRSPFGQNGATPQRRMGDVALFVGDESYYLWSTALEAALTLLARIGVQPTLIGEGCNNGFIAQSLGFPQTARVHAQGILDELGGAGAEHLIVLSAGDYYVFHQMYEERLGLHVPDDIQLIDLTTLLVSEMIEGNISFRGSDDETPCVYVDPTHAVRVPERFDAARTLLAAVMPNANRELFWRRERAHPVGSTAIQFAQPEIAKQLTMNRLRDAKECGAELLICEDPATLYHLHQYADEFDLRVQGLYELLATHLQN